MTAVNTLLITIVPGMPDQVGHDGKGQKGTIGIDFNLPITFYLASLADV